MKDLIEKILKYLPQYFLDLGSVFLGPKRFIAAKNVDTDEAFGDACLFFGISMTLLFVLQAPRKPANEEFWSYAGAEFGSILIGLILAGGAMCVAWWVVGGRASGRSIFVTYMYVCATATGAGTLMGALSDGILKTGNRPLYDQIIASQKTGATLPGIGESFAAKTTMLVFVSGYVLGVIWFLIAWGAFRQVNGIGRLRSFLALTIWGILAIPMALAFRLIIAALTPD